MRTGRFDMWRRVVACVAAAAVVSLAPVPLASAAGAAGNVVIRGTVYSADTGEPISGATVYAVHLDSRQVFSSAPSSSKGEYQITSLPNGYYDLVVETVDGLYLANRVVSAPAGEKVSLSLALGPPQPEDTEWFSAEPDRRIPGLDRVPDGVARIVEGTPRLGRPAVEAATGISSAPPKAVAAKTGGGVGAAAWAIPLAVGGGLILLGTVLDDDDDNAEDEGASPFE